MFCEYTSDDKNIPKCLQIYQVFFKCTRRLSNVPRSLQIYTSIYKYMIKFSKYTLNIFSHFFKPAHLQQN